MSRLEDHSYAELADELDRRAEMNERVEALRTTLKACLVALDNLPGGKILDAQLDDACEAAYKLAWQSLPGGSDGSKDSDGNRRPLSGMALGWAESGRYPNITLGILHPPHNERKW